MSDNNNLNSFSTIISILAVVVSIVITFGGYFATNATMAEKIDRLEDSLPEIRSDIKKFSEHHNKILLRIQSNESDKERVKDNIGDTEEKYNEINHRVKKLELKLSALQSMIRNMFKNKK